MSRILFFLGLFLLLTGLILGQQNTKSLLFVGTYTKGNPDKGIYVYEFNTNSGELKIVSTGENIINPSFLTISSNGRFLYSCTESKLPYNGSVSAFKIDSIGGKISFINKQSSEGKNPVYLSVHKNSKYVINGNYTEGNVSVYTTNPDGSLNPAAQIIQFTDSSINKLRQEKAHIHSTVFSPNNKYIFFPDLGADKIRAFIFDTTIPQPLLPKDNYTVNTVLGSGPRHFTFHPNGQFAYCVEELSGTVSAYSYKHGELDSIQRVFSYADTFEVYGSADIHISPDGLFLYASNRGEKENSLSVFSINQSTGRLTLLGHQDTFGNHPRNFTIDPSGKFLLVANQLTNNIIVFKRNLKTGMLTKTSVEIKVPNPSCLQMRVYGK